MGFSGVIFAEAAPAFHAGFSVTGAAAMTKTARRKGSQIFMTITKAAKTPVLYRGVSKNRIRLSSHASNKSFSHHSLISCRV